MKRRVKEEARYGRREWEENRWRKMKYGLGKRGGMGPISDGILGWMNSAMIVGYYGCMGGMGEREREREREREKEEEKKER